MLTKANVITLTGKAASRVEIDKSVGAAIAWWTNM
jgi:hypothetical protein